MPNFMGAVLTPIIYNVRQSASNNGGNCTWKFSQIKDPVASIIGKNNITKDGICEMLSAKWIECHALDGHLANWLQGGGGAIDSSKIRHLMQLFIIGSEMNRGAIVGNAQQGATVNQTEATIRWLKAKGILQRKSIKPMQFMNGPSENIANVIGGNRSGSGRSTHLASLGAAIANNLNTNGSYKTIGIWGPGGGHAMAAWVGHDATFFDPNFGEFWFENKSDFIAWFPKFFSKACYALPKLGLCERFEIMDFAKGV
ncbi:MAG: YopT peptidase [Oleiphilaceae bacterium]|jgi:YopT peptidase